MYNKTIVKDGGKNITFMDNQKIKNGTKNVLAKDFPIVLLGAQ